jgi:hypothetical protein
MEVRGCIQKFLDWPPGAGTENGTALCHKVQLHRYFVSQYSEFFRHNPLCCFSMSNTKGKHILPYRLSPETFGYTLVYVHAFVTSALDGGDTCNKYGKSSHTYRNKMNVIIKY